MPANHCLCVFALCFGCHFLWTSCRLVHSFLVNLSVLYSPSSAFLPDHWSTILIVHRELDEPQISRRQGLRSMISSIVHVFHYKRSSSAESQPLLTKGELSLHYSLSSFSLTTLNYFRSIWVFWCNHCCAFCVAATRCHYYCCYYCHNNIIMLLVHSMNLIGCGCIPLPTINNDCNWFTVSLPGNFFWTSR